MQFGEGWRPGTEFEISTEKKGKSKVALRLRTWNHQKEQQGSEKCQPRDSCPPGNAQNTLAQPTVWLTIVLTTAVCIMPVVAFRFLRLSLKPDLSDTVRSLAKLARGLGGQPQCDRKSLSCLGAMELCLGCGTLGADAAQGYGSSRDDPRWCSGPPCTWRCLML